MYFSLLYSLAVLLQHSIFTVSYTLSFSQGRGAWTRHIFHKKVFGLPLNAAIHLLFSVRLGRTGRGRGGHSLLLSHHFCRTKPLWRPLLPALGEEKSVLPVAILFPFALHAAINYCSNNIYSRCYDADEAVVSEFSSDTINDDIFSLYRPSAQLTRMILSADTNFRSLWLLKWLVAPISPS